MDWLRSMMRLAGRGLPKSNNAIVPFQGLLFGLSNPVTS
jgi:hypothetical protein